MNPEIISIGNIAVFIANLLLIIAALFNHFKIKRLVIPTFVISLILFLVFFGLRAYLKSFFPFTNKTESFITFTFMLGLLGVFYLKKISSQELMILILIAVIFGFIIFLFEDHIRYPNPYLRTIWYPLHVPISFLSYSFWTLAAICSLSDITKIKSGSFIKRDKGFTTSLNRHGFNLFTLSMVFGGIWGYKSWGAYFLWDPKLLWSVILWFYYGNLLHIDGLPKFKKYKEIMYFIGFILILITFIGTGFFSRSIHKF